MRSPTAPAPGPAPAPVLAAEPGRLDEPLLRGWYDAHAAARRHDLPGLPGEAWPDVLADLRVGDASVHREVWVVECDGRVVGGYRLELPLRENTDLGEVEVAVSPVARRQGLGRALLAHAAERVRGQGRHRLVLWGEQPLDTDGPGDAFARAVGARLALTEVQRLLDVEALDRAALAAAWREAEAHATSYEVVVWEGPAPEGLADGLAALKHQISTDAPMEDLTWAGEEWDVDRLRLMEAEAAAKGRHRFVAAARHAGDGHVAACTELVVPAGAPEEGQQWDTVVLPADRGHRLGLLVKLANLEQLRRRSPRTRRVTTWNAASNDPMVAVNDRLGFVAAARSPAWELRLG